MATYMNIEDLWFSLSFLFVDNDIDYEKIASEISLFSIDIIEFNLFYNVAPACANNIEQTIPIIWHSFDKKQLIADIKKHGIMSKNQITLKRKVSAKLFKYKYRNDWNALKSYLK